MLDLEGALLLQARQEVRYLLLEERQHSWHSHPCGPGMDPWMGVEQEAVVQGHKCHAGWHRSPSGVELPGSSFLWPWLTDHPRAVLWFPSTRVLLLLSCVSAEFRDLSFSSSGKLMIWGRAVSHCVSLPLTCCILFAGRLLCVSFQLLFVFLPNPQRPPSSTAYFKHHFYHPHPPRELLFPQ